MYKLILPLALALGGCAQGADLTRTDEARTIVWNAYKNGEAMPDVLWIWQSELNCLPGPITRKNYGFYLGGKLGEVASDGSCVRGATYFEGQHTTAQLALLDGENFSGLALAHEFFHAHLDATTGDPDYEHKNPGFEERYGHPAGGAVDRANDALKVEGL